MATPVTTAAGDVEPTPTAVSRPRMPTRRKRQNTSRRSNERGRRSGRRAPPRRRRSCRPAARSRRRRRSSGGPGGRRASVDARAHRARGPLAVQARRHVVLGPRLPRDRTVAKTAPPTASRAEDKAPPPTCATPSRVDGASTRCDGDDDLAGAGLARRAVAEFLRPEATTR